MEDPVHDREAWRIGVLFSQTGVTAAIERSQLNATLLAIDEINKAGGTPAGAISRLNMEIAKILRDPKVQERLASQTFEIKGGSPEELAKGMRQDAATNAKVLAEARITAE
jgi:ABC-type branched-subunit amino acid transport system substrate-binding protein